LLLLSSVVHVTQVADASIVDFVTAVDIAAVFGVTVFTAVAVAASVVLLLL
jgi:hypothetical protein